MTNNLGGQGWIGIQGVTTISGTGATVSPNTGTLYLIGGVSDSGTGGLTKTGSGTLILGSSVPGSFGGPLNINTGYLQVAGSAALTSGTTTIASGAMIDLNGIQNITGNIVVNGTGLNPPSLTPAALYNSNAMAASTSTSSTVTIGASGTAIGGYGNITLAGTVSDAGRTWTKVGPDMLTLSGSNAVTGTLTVTNGILQVASGLALGSGTTSALSVTVSSGGAMDLNGQTLIGGKTITLNGVGIANNIGVSTAGGYGTYANTLGALVNTSATSPATLPAAVALGAAASVGGVSFANNSAAPNPTPGVSPAAGDITLSGVVSGGQTLTKVGGDSLFLTNPANTFNLFSVNYGTVVLDGSGAFTTANQANTVNAGGSLVLDNSVTAVNNRLGGRGVVIDGDFTLTGNPTAAVLENINQGGQNFNLGYGQSIITLNASGGSAVTMEVGSTSQAFTQNVGTAVLRGTNLGLAGSGSTAGYANLVQTTAFNGTGYQNGAAGSANRGIVPAVLVDTSVTGSGLTFAVYGTNGYTTMGTGDSVNAVTATDNVWATSALTAPTTGSTQINSLTIGSGGSLAINGGTNTINIQSGGLLLASSAGAATISGNGVLTTGNLNTNLYVHVPVTSTSNTLTISSNVYMPAGSLIKGDGGQLSLAGNSTLDGLPLYSPVNVLGNYYVNSGTLQLTGGTQTLFQAFTTAPSPGNVGGGAQGYVLQVNNGGTVDLNGTNQMVDILNAGAGTDLTGGTVTNSSATTATLRIAPNGNVTWPGNIAGNVNFVRDGNNTFTINSPQSYTGSTTLIGGVTTLNDFATLQTSGIDIVGAVLRWDNSGIQAMGNRLTNSGGPIPITFDGGEFGFNARSGMSDTAAIGNVNLNSGSSRIDVQNNNGSATLNIGTISRQTGATVTFVAGLGASTNNGSLGDNPYIYMPTAPNLTNGMIGGWAVTMGQDIGQGGTIVQASFATYDPNSGIRGLTSYNEVGAGNAGNLFVLNGNTHLTGNTTLPGTLGVTSTTTINSLTMTGAQTLTFTNSTDTLVLQSGGLLGGTDGNNRTVGASQGQGFLTTAANQQELFLHNGANTLTINSNIVDNATGPVSVVMDSMNLQGVTITLAGSNNYSGTTYVNGVIVNLNSAARAISGTNVIISAATNNGSDSEGAGNSALVLQTNNQINPAAVITVKGGAQFNLNGGSQTVASLVFTDNGNSQSANGAALNTYGAFAGNLGAGTLTVTGSIASSTVGVSNPNNLGNVAATFDIPVVNGILNMTNATPTVYVDPTNVPGEIGLEMNAVLSTSGNAALVKTGSGILGLGAQTTFAGGINVNQGTVAFGAGGAYYPNSRVNLAAGTTFDTRALSGAIGSLTGSGLLQNYNLNTQGTLTTGLDNTNATFSGIIASPFSGALLNVTKAGSGVWTLNTDSTTVPTNNGTLTVGGGVVDISGTGRVGFTNYTLNAGGTLTLDNSATGTSNRLGGAYLFTSPSVATTTTTLRTLNFQGGSLNIPGNSSTVVTESLGTVTLGNAATSAGGSVLTIAATNTKGVDVVFNGANNGSLSNQNAYSTLLIRGDNLSNSTSGANTATVSSGTLNYLYFSDNITATGNNTTTISIRPDIIGDTSANGSGIGFVTRDTSNGYLRPLNATTESSTSAAALTLASTSGFATGFVNFSASSAQTLPVNVEVNSLTLGGSASLNATYGLATAGAVPQIIVNSGGILATGGTTSINASLTTGNNNNGSCYIHVAGAATVLNLNGPIMLSTNGLVKADAGTLVFNTPQFYSGGGGTQINGGLLQLNGGSNTIMVVPTATTPTVLGLGVNSGTLDLGGNVQAVGTLSSVNPLPGMGGTITNSSGLPATLVVDAGGNAVFGGAVANGLGGLSLYKQGNNTLTLTSPNTNTGTTYVEGGTLQLRDSGTLSSGSVNVNFATLLLDNTNLGALANRANAAIAINGGVLQFNATEGVDQQNVGAVTLGAGAAQIAVNLYNGNAQTGVGNLSVASLTPSASGSLNITTNAGTLGQWGGNGHVFINGSGTATTDGMLGGNIVINGTDFASYLATQGVGALGTTNFPGYSGNALTAGVPTDNINMGASALNVTARTVNSLAIRAPGAAVWTSLNTLADELTLNSGGLLVNDSQTKGVNIGGGILTSGTTSAASPLYAYINSNTTTVYSQIANNTYGGVVSVVKSGPGTLTLGSLALMNTSWANGSGTISVPGTTGLFAGEVIEGGNGLPNGATLVSWTGSTITLSQSTTAAGTNNWLEFAPATLATSTTAGNNVVTLTLASTQGWTSGMAVGGTGIPAGTVVAPNGISLVSGTTYALTLSNSATATGSPTLSYGAQSNTYTGPTIVNQGTLNLSGTTGAVLVQGNLLVNNATVTMNNVQGQIAPTSNVTIAGGGTVTLMGSNTLNSVTLNNQGGNANGTLALNNGLLTLSASNAVTAANDNYAYTPTISGGSLMLASATPTINTSGLSPNNLVISAPIIGTGGPLVKTGAGSLVLSATNNIFSGGVNLNQGTIIVAAASTLSATSNSTLLASPLGTGTVTTANGTTLMAGGGAQTIYNPLNVNGNLTFGGAAAANNLTVNGPVTLASGGSITVASATVTASINDGITSSGPLVKSGPGTLMLNSSASYSGATYITGGVLKVVPSQAGLFQGCVANGTNSNDTGDPIPPSSVQLSTPYANSSNINSIGTGTYNWSNNTTWGYYGYINNPTSSNVTYTFGKNFDDDVLLKIDGVQVINNTSWNTPVIANYTLTPGEHSFQLYLGQGGGGAGPNSSGWWTNTSLGVGYDVSGRSAAVMNDYAALVDPGNGSLLSTGLAVGSPIPATSSVVMSSNTVFDMSTGGTLAVGSLADAAGGETGAEVLLGNGTLTIGNDNTNQTYSGTLVGAGSGAWVTTGGGALIKIGTGVQTLTGSSSYSGGTTVTSGVLDIRNGLALGTGTVSVLNLSGTPQTSLWLDSPTGITVANNLLITGIGGGGGATTESGVIQNVQGNNTLSGLITLTSGGGTASGIKVNAGSLNVAGTVTNNIAGGAALVLGGTTSTGLVSGPITDGTGPTSLQKVDSGAWTLSGNNSYNGGTTLNGGTLNVTTASLPSGAGVNGTSAAAVLNFSQSSTGAYSGAISGVSPVVVSGTGTVALTGSSNYTAGTFVNAGKLIAASPSALGTGTVTVSGGTLSLSNYSSVSGFGLTGGSTGNSTWAVNNSAGTLTFPAFVNNTLTLTTYAANEARTAWYGTKVNPSQGFTANFIYQVPNSAAPADGMTFCFQTSGTGALGNTGGAFGYQNIANPTTAVEFNLYSGSNPAGSNSSSCTYLGTNSSIGGAASNIPTTGVNIASGDPINVTLSYNPATQTLTENLLDTITLGTYSTSWTGTAVSSLSGSNSVYMGFTGATGGAYSNQLISNFSMVNSVAGGGTYANAIAIPASTTQTVTVNGLIGGVNATSATITTSGGLTMGASSTLNVAADSTAATNQAYSLTIGGTTNVTNAATFNVANNGTASGVLKLTSISDGGIPAVIATTGSGQVSLLGTGNITLGTQFNVNAGTLNISDNNNLAAGTQATINVAAGATFGTPGNGNYTYIGALNGAGTVLTWGTPLVVGSGNSLNSSFSGVIADAGSQPGILFKSGSGTMTLTGPNTYTGATTVNSGRLVLGSGGALGNTAIQVNANGIFQPAVATSAGSITGGTLGATLNLNGGLFDMASDGAPASSR